ncbi:class I alpha-mannosidase-like protein [Delitschia confertaspora ATCC 74209]|uniref:alpha-1,2-Mannosidase n=1 Tax=Delitschia confertaspora ATCC 74209 TaxID=1513339 RepID=A0A9P4JLK0_9PLEO|nr:class I alpha-mannosidase-like protein [Delitschia confertaspora ATCC 74209]
MGYFVRRFGLLCFAAIILTLLFQNLFSQDSEYPTSNQASARIKNPIKWKDVPVRYPVSSFIPLPTGAPVPIPRIQYEFEVESDQSRDERQKRREAVKATFLRSWEAYKKHAWLQDEVTPISGGYKNPFGRRGATLVDALDTLLIMGLDKEFKNALSALKKIDFSTSEASTLNVFETTIRYLGGLLSAYDLSNAEHKILVEKALTLGDMLYGAFDTPNRMPITRWDWASAAQNGDQIASISALSAELGSLSLEFTRLSQITGDPKYFDAIQRITNSFEKHENTTKIPGLWPIVVNTRHEAYNADGIFTFGGMADSLYEYFAKEYILLGGLTNQYRGLYERAIDAGKKYLFFRPMNPSNQDILLSGNARLNIVDDVKLEPVGQHLACFTGGMVGIGAKIFDRPDDLDIARKLVDGCIWAYDSMPTGIMPETFTAIPCSDPNDCDWSIDKWHDAVVKTRHVEEFHDMQRLIREYGLIPGFTEISDRRFLLRPEAIESVFIVYRITGDPKLQEAAWRMFQVIQNATETDLANSAIADVTCPRGEETEKLDSCESFWMAETLKYFYLIFSEPDFVSLDEWVFNTEAHPLRRPRREEPRRAKFMV